MLTNRIDPIAKSFFLALLMLAMAMAPGAALSQTNSLAPAMAAPPTLQATPPVESKSDQIKQRWILSALIVVLLGVGAAYRAHKPQTVVQK